MSKDRSPSAFTFEIPKIGHIGETDLIRRFNFEVKCLINFYEENTNGPERDFLLHGDRAKIQQSDKINDIAKGAAELFFEFSDLREIFLAQNGVLSTELNGRVITLTVKSGAFWTRVKLGPQAETGEKVIKGASNGGKERNRKDTLIDHDNIKKTLKIFLTTTHGKIKGKKLSKQAIAKKIAEKTGDSFKTIERVCSKELEPYIIPKKTT